MGDSPQVLPPCASSCSPFFHTRTVFYEMGRQSVNSVVSIFKKIRFPIIIDGRNIPDLFAPGESWWFLFGSVPVICLFGAMTLVRILGDLFIAIALDCGLVIQLLTLVSVVYWYRDKPFRLIGARMKFMIEVIPMISAAAFRHFLEFHYGYLALTLCCSTNFYVYAHFMHASYDIGVIDVLFGLVMQVLFYTLNAGPLVRALALSFCFGLCFCRYKMYRAPRIPAHRKKELEQVPC